MTSRRLEARVACVVVGRNEAAHLDQAVRSAREQVGAVVYVDSASTDESVAVARSAGAAIVELDASLPLSAARAYNAGVSHLAALDPPPTHVQFLDGDARLVDGWVDVALQTMAEDPRVGVVSGRRREVRPRANVWHRLIDMEWNTVVGELREFGPDTLMRLDAFTAAGGFAEELIAAEEPELALRIRASGYRIVRVDADVSIHDVAMTSWRQWWRRARRSGFGAAQCAHRHLDPSERWCLRPSVSQWLWVVAVPAAALLSGRRIGRPGLPVALAASAAQTVRIARYRRHRHGDEPGDAWLYAVACMVGKLPELAGQVEYLGRAAVNRRRGLIEYH